MESTQRGQWDKLAVDYKSSNWVIDVCEIPFLESQFKRFGEEQGSAPWKALDVGCGMGKYTIRLLQAGVSYVLAQDVSEAMVEGAKKETDEFLRNQALPGKVDFHVSSATDLSSIPGAREGTFDLAICVYVCCTLLSKEEVKQVLAEIFKMLKLGGKLMLYDLHGLSFMELNEKNPWINVEPKEDGTKWNYYEDEGKPRQMVMAMNSGQDIKFINRMYTLSSWVSWFVEAGFQITQLLEPRIDPKTIATDASDFVKSCAEKPMAMFWECTKPLL